MGRQKQDPRKGSKRPGMAPTARKRRPQLSAEEIDWKNFPSLRRFLSERGKIRSRRITGLSRRQQSQLARAVKRARTMGLFPYPDQERGYRERSATGRGAPPPVNADARDDLDLMENDGSRDLPQPVSESPVDAPEETSAED
jgi:small subunit ribosomal protein S18